MANGRGRASQHRAARTGRAPAPAEPTATPTPTSGARALLAPGIAFVGLLALYVATLAPSVVGGDSGELIASALTGGVPHPPGYPLFALLARLFAVLPLGHSPAWRVNLLSAVSTAAAGGLVAAVVLSWRGGVAAALAAAALFGTSTEVWLHAVSAEVFGLNAMAVAAALLLWLRVERTHGPKAVWALAFASGLALCNHHTFLFVGAPLCARSLWIARRELGGKGIALSFAFGVLGLLPYAYLHRASLSAAAVSWGDLRTWDGFVSHILRRNYGTFSMGQVSKDGAFIAEGTFFPTLWHMAVLAVPRLAWIGGGLALLGLHVAFKQKRDRALAWGLFGTYALYVVGFATLSNLSTAQGLYLSVLSRFFIQADCLLAVAAGLGAARVAELVAARWPASRHAAVGALAVLALFALGVAANGRRANQSQNRIVADFVTTAFASLPPNAIVITMGDHLTGAVFYFREVERRRPDTIHLDRELLGASWYGERKRRLHPDLFLPAGVYGRNGWGIKRLLDGNPRRPVVVIDRLDDWDQSWKEGYKLATNGLVHPLVPSAQFPTFEAWRARDVVAMGDYDVMPALRAGPETWENALGQLVLATQGGRAHLALVYSHDRQNDPVPARAAIALLEDLVAKAGGDARLGIVGRPGLRPLSLGANVWKDMGIGYEILSRADPGVLPKVALAYANFVERAPAEDADLPAARRYVAEHPVR